ncbi:CIS tube protein [Streptomyces sp. NBC_01445]|uniref:CIS tube protein n=1 Tax=Streptomyces sp. NBC_01445 TaxID=2903869 RepID=UPI002DDC5B92|nr:hypothetical protein [Streptomyces sp. NBC_01445]WSE03780.1 hypothetical protein OG574_10610 [Streptomyces sp. NBC_01445]
MDRRTGYLANILHAPPLIFRFQYSPELLSEKKTFEYRESPDFGAWNFDRTEKGKAFGGTLGGFLDDVKEIGSLLVNTRGQQAVIGKPRTFALDFALDARQQPDIPAAQAREPVVAGDKRFGGRIEPSLAVLRSFMNPSWDPVSDLPSWISDPKKFGAPTRPPLCTLKLGGIDLDCVMTDLNIKVTMFKPDLTPERAEVSLTLTEQTHSFSTSMDVIGRVIEVVKSYKHIDGEDLVQAAPVLGAVQSFFD